MEPLRARDPRQMGQYELIGRLGEGGMGTVYLGRTPAGVLVAVKVVRADLAPDDEFRRRFRSEVARVQQVPPFCTAEVLDADPDHEQPYLVVEYVDGPTLAHVVEQRGPLTSANLHSVAIGVATALTAIHGAGVIHRDLKPRNVLLAPGTPKVIDFGIARAMEATSNHTTVGQMVGTVAYMAPERFGPEADAPLTPAADVFAWGSVVTYAGTGRTPFGGDSPPATAVRILTQPPELGGLSGPLRDLVAHALEKDPANRPSARELLDLLVAGPQRPPATAAALADQPDLRAAAAEAQSVTGLLTTPPSQVGYDEESIATQRIAVPSAGDPPSEPPEPRRRWFLPVAVAFFVLAVVTGAVMLVFGPPTDGHAAVEPTASTSPPVAVQPLIADDLSGPRLWRPKTEPSNGSSCTFDGELVARVASKSQGLYKCRGPEDNLPRDLSAEVGVRLRTPGACAAIWFRFQYPAGYQVRVCSDTVYVGTHKNANVRVIRSIPLDHPIAVGAPAARIGLRVSGETVTITWDGAELGTVELGDAEIIGNRLLLGVQIEKGTLESGPFEVGFDHIAMWPLGER